MRLDRLDELAADRVERIERGQRVLEDRADLPAADLAHRVVRQRVDALAVEAGSRRAAMRPGGSSRPMIAAPVSDLPAPDSPTTPSTSPGAISNETSSQRGQRAAPGRKLDAQIAALRAAAARSVGRRRLSPLHLPIRAQRLHAQSRVERVAQPVAEQVHREHDHTSAMPGKQRDPPFAREQEIVADADQRAERRLRRRHAHAEERQRRLGDDRRRDVDRRDHQHRSEHIGQHMASA